MSILVTLANFGHKIIAVRCSSSSLVFRSVIVIVVIIIIIIIIIIIFIIIIIIVSISTMQKKKAIYLPHLFFFERSYNMSSQNCSSLS